MSVYFYSTNPCATCAPNGILLAEAKLAGLDYEFKFAAGMNADILAAYKKGVKLPFFTDGKIFAKTASDFLEAQATALLKAKKSSKKTAEETK